jgi:hypothetical protein
VLLDYFLLEALKFFNFSIQLELFSAMDRSRRRRSVGLDGYIVFFVFEGFDLLLGGESLCFFFSQC